MKIFSAIVYCCSVKPPALVTSEFDLSSFGFFKRSTVKEFLSFASREVAIRTDPGAKQTVKHSKKDEVEIEFHCHTYVNLKNLGCVVITDGEYPFRVAYDFINKIMDEVLKQYGDKIYGFQTDQNLRVIGLEEMLLRYEQPKEVDNIMKITKDLDETKEILMKSIDKILERGEKLEDLMERSQDLSFQSKAFMKGSKDLNGCCNII